MTYGFSKITLVMTLLVTPSLTQAKPNSEGNRIQAVSDEWRKTYKFDQGVFDQIQTHLSAVMDTHVLIEQSSINEGLKAQLLEAQKASLQKIVNKDSVNLPYLLREYANVISARANSTSGMNPEFKNAVTRHLRLKEQAIEAAITSSGLSAVPLLSDLHARSSRLKADALSRKVKNLLTQIVKREQLELEKMKLVGESQAQTPAPTPAPQATIAAEIPPSPMPEVPAGPESFSTDQTVRPN